MRATVILAFGVLTLFANSGAVANKSPRNLRRVAVAGEENDVRMKELIPNTSISTTFGPEEERGVSGRLFGKLSGVLEDLDLSLYATLQASRTDKATAVKNLMAKKRMTVEKLHRIYRLDDYKKLYDKNGNESPEAAVFRLYERAVNNLQATTT
uniref:RxLR effector protein n=1 Tax=Peronospora matthiolae TaxID=2874970 RepID=A0AAV1TUG2_9STRA